jgi:hypothetical protein
MLALPEGAQIDRATGIQAAAEEVRIVRANVPYQI